MLNVEKLSIAYGDVQVVWDIDFHVNEGEMVAIIGANGAGKTTTLNTIAGVRQAKSGSVTFNGVELVGLSTPDIIDYGISIAPEGRQIFYNMSIEENLYLGAYIKRAKTYRMETLAEMYELFPRLAERRNQKAGTLSGGEQQMLAVARALMSKPRLLMLDEPSLGLAPKIVNMIFDSIRVMREKTNMTILIVEQDVKKALKIADRAYVMENGSIVNEGQAQSLLNDPSVKRAYLGI